MRAKSNRWRRHAVDADDTQSIMMITFIYGKKLIAIRHRFSFYCFASDREVSSAGGWFSRHGNTSAISFDLAMRGWWWRRREESNFTDELQLKCGFLFQSCYNPYMKVMRYENFCGSGFFSSFFKRIQKLRWKMKFILNFRFNFFRILISL